MSNSLNWFTLKEYVNFEMKNLNIDGLCFISYHPILFLQELSQEFNTECIILNLHILSWVVFRFSLQEMKACLVPSFYGIFNPVPKFFTFGSLYGERYYIKC
jgi:hypothetical protein